jgi:peptidyl-prolyl cis-trans isomerase D
MFENTYALEREKQKKILGKKFFELSQNENFIKENYNYILSQLVNNVLLEQYTKKMQLQINDEEIKKIILNSSLFQINNKFNKEKYLNYLASINLSNDEYINIIKTKINTENLIRTISSSNFILQNEQKNILQLLSQKRIFRKSIVEITPQIHEQHVTNAEAQNYFSQYKNHFYIPEKFKISFVKLELDNFRTKCNKQEIHNWYLKNIKKYLTIEKRKYSIIQIKNKHEALLILSKLHKNPEDFSKIAKEKSTDPIASKNNGSIGWIPINSIPTAIRNANLNNKNEISNIIPFHNEFLIVKLDEILPKKQKKINEVYDTIKKEIKYKKSRDLYHKFQKKISDIIQTQSNPFDFILKTKNISVQETNWFDQYSVPRILDIPKLKKIIFNKKQFKKNKILKSHFHFIILKNNQSFLININDFKNKKMQVFQNVKNHIINKLKFIKAIEATKQKAEKIINELKKGNKNLFEQSKLLFNPPEIISRYNDNPIASIIFSLPHPKEGEKKYTLYQDTNNNFVIISLDKIYNKNFSEEEKNIILKYLEKNNTEIIFNALLKNLHSKAIITYEKIDKI